MIDNLQHEINRANEKITEALDKLEKRQAVKSMQWTSAMCSHVPTMVHHTTQRRELMSR
jgi:hypothetical protein